ncbi:hypothetical protein QP178_07150 [Sphingomonas aurantiaca]|uniref:hypothetical protein n=1 Tax=Sphingomonas aurantiaca TaxID=185949 RepID=UPI002FE3A0DE
MQIKLGPPRHQIERVLRSRAVLARRATRADQDLVEMLGEAPRDLSQKRLARAQHRNEHGRDGRPGLRRDVERGAVEGLRGAIVAAPDLERRHRQQRGEMTRLDRKELHERGIRLLVASERLGGLGDQEPRRGDTGRAVLQQQQLVICRRRIAVAQRGHALAGEQFGLGSGQGHGVSHCVSAAP